MRKYTTESEIGNVHWLLYSSCFMALTACKISRAIRLSKLSSDNMTQVVYSHIMGSCATQIIIKASVLVDSSANSLSVEHLVRNASNKNYTETMKNDCIKKLNELLLKHQAVVKKLIKLRHDSVAHLTTKFANQNVELEYGLDMNSLEDFLDEMKKFIESLPMHKQNLRILKPTEVQQILGLEPNDEITQMVANAMLGVIDED